MRIGAISLSVIARSLCAGFVALLPATARAATLTFSEPEIVALMTNTFVGTHVMHYSDSMSSFTIGDITLEAFGAVQSGQPTFYFRTTFDDRAPRPYSYDFIADQVAQVRSTGLKLSFVTPVARLEFGAALNSTSSPSLMEVELFNVFGQSLGKSLLELDRTILSSHGGTNSNSEGHFVASSATPIAFVRLTNFGDGSSNGSQYNWVIDNIAAQAAVPEPTAAVLMAIGMIGWRARRHWPPAQAPHRQA